jgi:UDP-3-O-[3-hydroxymyristoyl] glucosamine N-acyltransferase
MEHLLSDLAEHLGAKLHGDADVLVSRLSTLEAAKTGDISFLANKRYRKHLSSTGASAVVLNEADLGLCKVNALVVDDPYLAYARLAQLFAGTDQTEPVIEESAVIHHTARLADSISIGPGSVIEANAVLSDNVNIGANCVVAEGVSIGEGSRLHASVTLCRDVAIGDRCLIHSGVVIGSDGFGLANDKGRWIKIAQLGSVVVGNDVEIGANTTIDRGAINDTVIGNGVKLDNQIQIAHNVEIGDHTAIAACTGISGSTRIGRNCAIGGGVGIVGHVEIADGVQISAMSLVSHSLNEAGVYTGGILAMPHNVWRKNLARIKQLDDIARRVRKLEKSADE